MKKLILMIAFSACSLFGTESYGKQNIGNLTTNGDVELLGTNVTGWLQINGSLNANGAQIYGLQVNGQANLQDTIVSTNAFVNGIFTALRAVIEGELSIATRSLLLRSTWVRSLYVRTVPDPLTQVVHLYNGSTVGTVSFESGYGEVHLYDSSKVGQVWGGRAINHPSAQGL